MKYVFLSILLVCAPAVQAAPPNIVFILADDLGVGDVSALNPEAKLHTPELDALVAGGMNFTDAHTASAVCTPTRYSLLTGCYSWRSELKKGVLQGYSRALVKPDRDTVASLLKRNGYNTAMVGKWHLGLNWKLKEGSTVTELKEPTGIEEQIDFTQHFGGGPVDLGFDYWYGINASLDFPPYVWLENNRAVAVPTQRRPFQGGKQNNAPDLMMRGGLQVPGFTPEMILKGLAEKAVKYIELRESGQPFFLYIALNSPHTPVVPREGFVGMSECGIYGDFVQETDWCVGEVVSALKKQGLLKNTLVVFTADNGASRASYTPEMEERFGHNPSHIYKGRKGSLAEGGHRVPYIVHWPDKIPAGSRCDTACNLTDLYATCAALVGAEIAPAAGVDSFSMLPLLAGNSAEYSRNGMVHHDFGGRFAFRDGKWKLITSKSPNKIALYDMEADPSETNNLHTKHPEVVSMLEKKLTRIVLDGRSTKGPRQNNEGPAWWEQLVWMEKQP